MTREEFNKELTNFKDRVEEGNAARKQFIWIQQRFQLEYPENHVDKLCAFVSAFVPAPKTFQSFFEDSESCNKRMFAFLSEHPANENTVDEIWRSRPKEFIRLLQGHRSMPDKELENILMGFVKNINNDSLRYVYELLQNADDCRYDETPTFTLDLSQENQMTVSYPERGMNYADIIAITTIGQSNKRNRKARRLIGEKGIGFKTIFSVCSSVDIHSSAYHFTLSGNSLQPKWCTSVENQGTRLILHFEPEKGKTEDQDTTKNEVAETIALMQNTLKQNKEIYQRLKEKYGFAEAGIHPQLAFQNCPILFTNRLIAITVKGETESFSITRDDAQDELVYCLNGTEVGRMGYHRYEKNVEIPFADYEKRYPGQFTEADYNALEDKTAITYPIALVAAKDTEHIQEGTLYAYLPTDTKIKAPINLQLPLKLNLDRSCMWFVGDPDTTTGAQESNPSPQKSNSSAETISWNNHLLHAMFFAPDALLKTAYKDLRQKDSTQVFQYIPHFQKNDHGLFQSADKFAESIQKLNLYMRNKCLFDVFKNIPYFTALDAEESACTAGQALMLDVFIRDNFQQAYFQTLKDKGLNEGKYLVPYSKLALEKTACFDFQPYALKDKEKENEQKTAVLNVVCTGHEKAVWEEANQKDPSQYLPRTPECLRQLPIFPARSEDETVYCAMSKKEIWFYLQNEGFHSLRKLGFLAEDFAEEGLLAQTLLNDIHRPKHLDDICDTMFERDSCSQALFEDWMWLCMEKEDKRSATLYQYVKDIFQDKKNPSTLWQKKRVGKLADLLSKIKVEEEAR